MRQPSSRIIRQSCQVYPATRGQDTTGGVQYTYPIAASMGLRCSAQPHEYEEIYENDRITQVRHWRLMFTSDPGVKPRDMLVWTDHASLTHTGYVQTSRDEAGRGLAYTVRAIEKL